MAYFVALSLHVLGYRYGMPDSHSLCRLPLTPWHQLTWLDRLSGGAMFMVHSPGMRPPNTHAVPEEARLDVFLPIVLLKEFPELRPIFAQLVQAYAQHVATVTMERWDRAKGLHFGGALHQADVPRLPSGRQRRTELIPEGSTPYRVFHGRPIGELERLLTQPGEMSSLSISLAHMGLSPTTSSGLQSSPSASTTTSPTRPARSASSAEYISPPGMSHIRLQYHTDDPWTKTDLIEMAKMEEASSSGAGRDFDSAHVNEKLISLAETYDEELKRLRETVRSQEEEIARLKQLLNRNGTSVRDPPRYDIILCSDTPSRKVIQPGSPTAQKHTTHTATQNQGTPSTGKGKSRAQSRVPLPSASFSPVSPVSSISSPSSTARSVVGGQSASPSTPIPSHVDAVSSRLRSLPNTPVGTTATRSSRQPAGVRVQGGTTLGPQAQGHRGVGLYARQTVVAHGFPFRIFPIIASVQGELAPEEWYAALQQRIDDSTDEFISALVDSMRKDLRLPPLPK